MPVLEIKFFGKYFQLMALIGILVALHTHTGVFIYVAHWKTQKRSPEILILIIMGMYRLRN